MQCAVFSMLRNQLYNDTSTNQFILQETLICVAGNTISGARKYGMTGCELSHQRTISPGSHLARENTQGVLTEQNCSEMLLNYTAYFYTALSPDKMSIRGHTEFIAHCWTRSRTSTEYSVHSALHCMVKEIFRLFSFEPTQAY